jgi:hypothetical protein
VQAHVAPATIELPQCEADAAAPCGINNIEQPAKPRESELHALPPSDPKQPRAADPASPVPEPETFVMLMLGLVVMGFASRRRDKSEKFSG